MEQLEICIDGNYVFISNGSNEQLDYRIGGMAIEISQLFSNPIQQAQIGLRTLSSLI